MNGLLNVLKPPGMTSHDVVACVRRLTGAKVGHTGTLDPAAAGVLVLTIGNATRIAEYIALNDKRYRAEVLFGVATDSGDLEGEVTRRESAAHLTRDAVEAAAAGLEGELEMLPPMFSAVKQGGRKLYDLARRGEEVERKPRRVSVRRFEVLGFAAGEEARCACDIACSKGTYVRSLAELCGERLGCPACLSFLLRTAHGRHELADAATLEEVAQAKEAGELGALLIPVAAALPEMAQMTATDEQAERLRHGNDVALPGEAAGMVMVVYGGEALCLGEVWVEGDAVRLRPTKVLG